MGRFAQLFPKAYLWHRRLGLFLAIQLFVLTTSGMLLVFREELEGETGIETLSTEGEKRSLQSLVDEARQILPGAEPLAINYDDDHPNRLTVRMGLDGSTQFRGARKLAFDRYQGKLADTKPEDGFWTLLLKLHREFLLGFYGKLYVGFVGLLFLLCLVSGAFIYGPTMARLAFGTIRRGRLSWTFSDIHKLLAASSFAWLLLIALTGTLLAVTSQILTVYQWTELGALKAKYAEPLAGEAVPVDQAEAKALGGQAGAEVAFITFPGTEYATAQHYLFVLQGTSGLSRFPSEIVLVDALTGELTERRFLPWYLRALVLSEPLHFGNYGGWPLKAIWFVYGCVCLFLISSGPLLWWQKRRKVSFTAEGARTPIKRDKHPYRVPAYLAGLTSLACVWALWGAEWGDALAILGLCVPLLLLLRRFLAARTRISSPSLTAPKRERIYE